MTIEKKLTICIVAMLVVVLGLAAGGWYTNQKFASRLNFAMENSMTRAILSGQLRGEIVAMSETQRGIGYRRNRPVADRS